MLKSVLYWQHFPPEQFESSGLQKPPWQDSQPSHLLSSSTHWWFLQVSQPLQSPSELHSLQMPLSQNSSEPHWLSSSVQEPPEQVSQPEQFE